MLGNRPDAPRPRLLRVDRTARPGWKTGQEQVPDPGQRVYCTEGMAEVVRIAGKTGDGSPLLELRLLEKEAPPFFAAASNVLVMPADAVAEGVALNGSVAAEENGTADAAAGDDAGAVEGSMPPGGVAVPERTAVPDIPAPSGPAPQPDAAEWATTEPEPPPPEPASPSPPPTIPLDPGVHWIR